MKISDFRGEISEEIISNKMKIFGEIQEISPSIEKICEQDFAFIYFKEEEAAAKAIEHFFRV